MTEGMAALADMARAYGADRQLQRGQLAMNPDTLDAFVVKYGKPPPQWTLSPLDQLFGVPLIPGLNLPVGTWRLVDMTAGEVLAQGELWCDYRDRNEFPCELHLGHEGGHRVVD